jgi:hypothetical protein
VRQGRLVDPRTEHQSSTTACDSRMMPNA